MLNCEICRGQLLEYLYDLPDEDEQRVFQEHLPHCPTCPALLREAREQQRLLGAAARMTFPRVHFEAPAEAASARPQILALPMRSARTRWLPWAVAAPSLASMVTTSPTAKPLVLATWIWVAPRRASAVTAWTLKLASPVPERP